MSIHSPRLGCNSKEDERCLRNQDDRSRTHEEFIRDRAISLDRLAEGSS